MKNLISKILAKLKVKHVVKGERIFVLAEESWLDKVVRHPKTGNKVKVKSLPPDLQEKYRPNKKPSPKPGKPKVPGSPDNSTQKHSKKNQIHVENFVKKILEGIKKGEISKPTSIKDLHIAVDELANSGIGIDNIQKSHPNAYKAILKGLSKAIGLKPKPKSEQPSDKTGNAPNTDQKKPKLKPHKLALKDAGIEQSKEGFGGITKTKVPMEDFVQKLKDAGWEHKDENLMGSHFMEKDGQRVRVTEDMSGNAMISEDRNK